MNKHKTMIKDSQVLLSRWSYSGEMSEPRQGSIILLVDGKPTIFGGFNNYDTYPTLVEQFDPDLGNNTKKKVQNKKSKTLNF